MPDPFASALDVIFYAPGSEAAEHVSSLGVLTIGIRIIRGRNDQLARLGEGQIITATNLVEVRKSQLAELCAGDTLVVGELGDDGRVIPREHLLLTGEAVGDTENLTWTIGAEPFDPTR